MNIGDEVICNLTGIVGTIVKFYTPTACEEQTMVRTKEGLLYHAPRRTWVKVKEGSDNGRR